MNSRNSTIRPFREAEKMRDHGRNRAAGLALDETRKNNHGRVVAFAHRKDWLIGDEFKLRVARRQHLGHGRLAAMMSEERKHLDRRVADELDIVVDGIEDKINLGLPEGFVDGAQPFARRLGHARIHCPSDRPGDDTPPLMPIQSKAADVAVRRRCAGMLHPLTERRGCEHRVLLGKAIRMTEAHPPHANRLAFGVSRPLRFEKARNRAKATASGGAGRQAECVLHGSSLAGIRDFAGRAESSRNSLWPNRQSAPAAPA